jgi:peptide/nickel transport system permease protein
MRKFLHDPFAAAATAVLLILVLVAVFAPLLAPQDPYDLGVISIFDGRLPPGSEGMDGTYFWLGTDGQGRDMLSGMLFGLRASLMVGAASALIACGLGTAIGFAAAYSSGPVDAAIMRVVDFQLSLPTILVALVLVVLLGRGVDRIILALVLVQWAYYARVTRGTVLVELAKDYVPAAQCLMIPFWRIALKHVLPNCLPPLTIVLMAQIGSAIMLEASLSFLGLGMPVTQPSLGMLIANGFEHLLNGRFWISIFPGLLLMVSVLAINLIGDRLRELNDPRG